MSGLVLGIVPARLASTRLPNKPLYPLLGKPLIEWVWRRVSAMTVLDHVVVATDSREVAEVCRTIGAPVELTSSDHLSGTDRVAEVAERPRYGGYDIVANLQGDEPLLNELHVRSAIDLVRHQGWQVGTCATPVQRTGDYDDPSVVKVVRASSGRALYFSRAQIPYASERTSSAQDPQDPKPETFLRHIGLYIYERLALHAWATLAPSPLEQIETLEQLRALEAGLQIGVAIVGPAEPGVDTPADAARMEEQLSRLNHPTPV